MSTNDKTRIDLGEDLLEQTVPLSGVPELAESTTRIPNSNAQISDQMVNAKILLNEGMLEEAKKVLRGILIFDAHHVAAKTLLDEIHDRELKQIFGEINSGSSRVKKGPNESVESAEIVRQLDEELRLGIAGNEVDLSEFKKQVELQTRGLGARDRLDLGIGFLEMGLHEIALMQFQSAASDSGLGRIARSLEAAAQVAIGKYYEAMSAIEPFLGDQELHDHEKIDLFYLMGRACEGLGKPDEARFWYNHVVRVDEGYRDTRIRVGRLGQKPRQR